MWSDRPSAARTARRAEALRALLPVRGHGGPVQRDLSIDLPAEELAARLRRRRGLVWLDGDGDREHLIAFDPIVEIRARAERSRLVAAGTRRQWRADGFAALDAVREAFAEHAGAARWFGLLGYELAFRLESLPAPAPGDLPVPDLAMGLHDLWLRGRADRWQLVGTDAWRGPEEIEALAAQVERIAREPAAAVASAQPEGEIRSQPGEGGYREAVARTVRRIYAGEIFETNLCRRLEVAMATEGAWDLYLRMRRTGPADYGAFVRAGRASVLSRSPECFLSARAGVVRSRPIKGTRPRDADVERDAEMRRELVASEKDRAELAMIVDLVRNDLGRVCTPGSVRVLRHAEVMRLDTVWHTVSEIEGRLAEGVGPVELLRASFPPGSITGAPKIEAIAVAAREEPRPRGAAMGSIGWIALDGDLELSVAIRTAVAAAGRVVYHAGCGIVADSDPDAELEETRAKARVFLRALAAGSGRSLAADPSPDRDR